MSSIIVRDGKEKSVKGICGISEQFLQVCHDYNGIGDFRNLSFEEIRFFYNGLIPELKETTKPSGK